MTASADRRWAAQLQRLLSDLPAREQAALVAERVAAALDVDSPIEPSSRRARSAEGGHDPASWPTPPGGWADPRLVGHVHERAATPQDRKRRGAWYTPASVVTGLTAAALARGDAEPAPDLIIDPTCGGGAFLLAALDLLERQGVRPAEAVGRVRGLDLDETAVEVTRWAVLLWLWARVPAGVERHEAMASIDIRLGDALAGLPASWTDGPVAVVGNPPFASPLKAGAMPERAVALRQERHELLGPYADLGALHLLHAVESVAAGSTVALVQPQSVLSGRDTAGLRDWCDERGWLRGLWAARTNLFDAGIRPCAPILHLRPDPEPALGSARPVALFHGPNVTARGHRPLDDWGPLAADALGAPRLPELSGETLGSLATATAGFRDEHYALAAACQEWEGDDTGPPPGGSEARVVTVGSVDPLWVDWGVRPYRFGGRCSRSTTGRHRTAPP
ncbi:MAG: N-6 DNA methylase, partial [Actinomycetota bacterium]